MISAKHILLVFSFLIAGLTFSQDKDIPFDKRLFEDKRIGFEEAVKEIKLGDFYFFDGRDEFLMEALSHFLKAQEFNPFSSILNYKIGICYLYSIEKTKSLSHLEFAHKVNPTLDVDLKLYLAQAYQISGDFETAIHFYDIYKALIPANDKRQHLFIAKKIAESRTGMALMDNPVRVWIDNLGDSINSEYSEFSPVISADDKLLFYTARRPDSQGQKKDRSGKYYEDIYFSTQDEENGWSAAQNIGAPVNTDSHDATVGVAPDGKSILTYQGVSSKNGDILITKQLDDGTWEEPVSIGIGINSKHHESSATLSFDEKMLFFVSDQPGGFGQHDIYVSHWDEENEEWGVAQNLGNQVNTEFEELGVFFHANSKTLYFSSDGHDNMGGLDVFKSVFNSETQEWSAAENIGYPVNTPDDDIYFVVTGNGRYAYYSSNRPGGFGEKDIYKITFIGPKKEAEVPEITNNTPLSSTSNVAFEELTVTKELFLLNGKIVDGETKLGTSGQVYITNAETNKIVKTIKTLPDGSFSTVLEPGSSYALTATGQNFTISSKTLITNETFSGLEQNMNFVLYPPSADTINGHSFVLRNIYFGFNESNLEYSAFDSQTQIELDLLANLLRENPTMTIELAGHTDRRGSNNYNMELSENRAQIAKQYLVEKGISESRIQTVGHGENQPEVTWQEIKEMASKSKKEEGHQKNRRTVVTILTR